MDCLPVGRRQRPGEAEAARAGVDVWILAKGQLAAAEHLRPGLELNVDLEPDHRLVFDRAQRLSPFPSGRAAVERDLPLQRKGGVEQCVLGERGRRELQTDRQAINGPQGIETAGIPASDIGTVYRSLRYIASGSSVFAPSSNAGPGVVGVTTKSNSEKAALKSSAIRVRTLRAVP